MKSGPDCTYLDVAPFGGDVPVVEAPQIHAQLLQELEVGPHCTKESNIVPTKKLEEKQVTDLTCPAPQRQGTHVQNRR